MYNCDITYGTNAEFGFDYLRDNGMASRKEEPPPSPPIGPETISAGSMSGSIRPSRSRGARMIVRSTTLRNCRTLPGQS